MISQDLGNMVFRAVMYTLFIQTILGYAYYEKALYTL